MVLLPHEVRGDIKENRGVAMLCESYCDAIYGSVAFTRAEEVLWSDSNCIGWVPYSWNPAGVATVSGRVQDTNKRNVSRARWVVEKYVGVKVFMYAGSSLSSVADAQRQIAEWCVKVIVPGYNNNDNDHGSIDKTPERFQSQFEMIVASQRNGGEAAPSNLGDMFALSFGHSEAVDCRRKRCSDTKDAAEEHVSLIEK